jgi:hypothetical protein
LRKTQIALIAGAIAAAVIVLGIWHTTYRSYAATASQAVAAPSGPTDTPCGNWSVQGSAAATAIVSNRTIRNCLQVGDDWIVAAVGGTADSAGIGVLSCHGDATCLHGQADPSAFGTWQWFKPGGFGGDATVLDASGSLLLVDVSGHELTFDLATGTSSAAATFATATGG